MNVLLAGELPSVEFDAWRAALAAERERLVANLLDLSRLEAGALVACMDWCAPAEIVAGGGTANAVAGVASMTVTGVLSGSVVLQATLGGSLNSNTQTFAVAASTPAAVSLTAQGSILSPLLGNIYLHYVLDRWFTEAGLPALTREGPPHPVRR